MQRYFIFLIAVFSALVFTQTAYATEYQNAFLQNVRGQWSGKGEVVAGRYKGTKFSCKFNTPELTGNEDMNLNGSCRYGIFSQAINATIHRKGNSFKGNFNEGAKARGLDIIAGKLHQDQITLELDREDLKGRMTAQLDGDNLLRITLAVKIDEEAIPLVGMKLTRIEQDPPVVVAKDSSTFAWLR